MIEPFECTACHKVYEPIEFKSQCTCGGFLLSDAWERPLAAKELLQDKASLWRYKEYFLPENNVEWEEISMGEGFTPLITLDRDNPSILLKLEALSPLSGIRDRGYAVLATLLQHYGIEGAGLYPKHERERLAWQTYRRRARLKHLPDSNEQAGNEPYYHPFFLIGIQTYAYEIWEQLSGKKLDFLVFPASDPSFILGAFLGFKQLVQSQLIDEYPAFLLIEKEALKEEEQPAYVKGQILKILDLTKGKRVIVAQAEIIQAQKALGARTLPNNEEDALLYAGFMRYYRDHSIKDQLAILPIGLMNGGV